MNILICGIGGQGTVLASKILSQTALMKGYKVFSAETIGMAQRGGSVVSHIRFGNENEAPLSPLIPLHQADVIIAFEISEAVRNIDYLKKGGVVIVNKQIIQPVSASLSGKSFVENDLIDYLRNINIGHIEVVDTSKACNEIGSSKCINILLLSVSCKFGLFEKEEIEKAMQKLIKKEYLQLNIKALNYFLNFF